MPDDARTAVPVQSKPATIRRMVDYHPERGDGPHVAIIVKVWNDECVNLAVFDQNGNSYPKTSVSLGEGPGRWSWPDFQQPAASSR